MLRIENLEQYNFDDVDPWAELLASVAWDIRSTYHTTLQASPTQLVFGRDMLLDMKFIADWEVIRLKNKGMLIRTTARRIV